MDDSTLFLLNKELEQKEKEEGYGEFAIITPLTNQAGPLRVIQPIGTTPENRA